MKFSRLVAVFLILVLTTSQALAAVCSASCLISSVEPYTQLDAALGGELAANEHCQHNSDSSDQHHPKKTACSIAGCHLAQTATFPSDSQQFLFRTPVTDFPRFISTAVSADLPPPIKPPA